MHTHKEKKMEEKERLKKEEEKDNHIRHENQDSKNVYSWLVISE